jgi:RNA ligase (TIGR02306 family)
MPSDCIVPVVEVRNVREHPNADMLSIVEVLGYQMVTGLVEDPRGPIERHFVSGILDEKGRRIPANGDYPEDIAHLCDVVEGVRFSFRYREGDRAVYFPADTVLTDEWAEKFEVKPYLGTGNRVKRARLREEPSFGLIVALPDGVDWELGRNVADYYDAKKWEPDPDKVTAPDAAPYDSDIDPHFVEYTDIQNGKLLFEKFLPGEMVVATEKIHGKNARFGIVNGGKAFVVGSRTYRKQDPNPEPSDGTDEELKFYKGILIWEALIDSGVRQLLYNIWNDQETFNAKTVIVFGEVYGRGVQSLHYGRQKQKGFRAFDIYVDGNYLDYDSFVEQCKMAGVETVPALYRGPFDLAKIQEVSNGRSELPGADNIREGVVVRPVVERRDPALGRVVLKFISTDYELSRHKKKDKVDV